MSTTVLSSTSGRDPVPWRYTRTAVWLHWLLAVLLAAQVGVGWYMLSIEKKPNSAFYFNLHKSVGLIIATLVVLRIFWRLTHPRRELPDGTAGWERVLSPTSQGLLYLVMVLMPITGYIGASYSKHPVAFFGLPLPAWATPDHDLSEQFFNAHGIIAWVLVGIVSLHLLGALKHLFVDHDGVFQRMWTTGRR